MAPDAVIIAAGAAPIVPRIPGIGMSRVISAVDLFNSRYRTNCRNSRRRCSGMQAAAFLAGKGVKVTVVEMTGKLAADLNVMNRNELMEILAEQNMETLLNTTVSEITDDGVILSEKSGERRELKADGVVIAVGLRSRDGLYKALTGKVDELYAIGDCVKPRKIMAAMGSYRLARLITSAQQSCALRIHRNAPY